MFWIFVLYCAKKGKMQFALSGWNESARKQLGYKVESLTTIILWKSRELVGQLIGLIIVSWSAITAFDLHDLNEPRYHEPITVWHNENKGQRLENEYLLHCCRLQLTFEQWKRNAPTSTWGYFKRWMYES